MTAPFGNQSDSLVSWYYGHTNTHHKAEVQSEGVKNRIPMQQLQDQSLQSGLDDTFTADTASINSVTSEESLKEGEILIDSACFQHMSPDRTLFTNMKPSDLIIEMVNGIKDNIRGEGTITFYTIDNKGLRWKQSIDNVLYVPMLKKTLLATQQYHRKGPENHIFDIFEARLLYRDIDDNITGHYTELNETTNNMQYLPVQFKYMKGIDQTVGTIEPLNMGNIRVYSASTKANIKQEENVLVTKATKLPLNSTTSSVIQKDAPAPSVVK